MRQSRNKRDKNQREVVNEFTKRGFTVFDTADVGFGFPDLVVGGVLPCPQCGKRIRQNILVEVKAPEVKPLPRVGLQEEFHKLWRGRIVIVQNPQDITVLTQMSQAKRIDDLTDDD
jgi:hypothetical protein